MNEDIPQPWKTALDAKGLGSYRRLGDAAGMTHETARKVVRGLRTSDGSIRKVADAIGIDVEQAYEWRREATPDYGAMFEPDPQSSLLTTDERAAVNNLIRLMTKGREGHADSSPSNTDAGATPAEKFVPPPGRLDPREWDLVGRPGEVETPPDTTTGEESQDPGESARV